MDSILGAIEGLDLAVLKDDLDPLSDGLVDIVELEIMDSLDGGSW